MTQPVEPPPDAWETPQKILVLLAHPDDPEFFCGGTLALWAEQGREIRYCLLTRGARKVYAVDVGYGQLDQSLRRDPRVVSLERQNLRLLPREAVPEPIDLITLDLSFISLTLVLPRLREFLRPGGEALAMVKPQFEVGKGKVGKGGVVRDPKLQQEAVAKVAAAAAALGFQVSPAFPSPLKGPKGNQEYFLYLVDHGKPSGTSELIDKNPDEFKI